MPEVALALYLLFLILAFGWRSWRQWRHTGDLGFRGFSGSAGPLERACLYQDKAASAAVAFLVVGEIEAARKRAGDRSYRDLLLGAGALAERIYLGAEAIDLGARNLAAFFDDPLNELVKLDGQGRAVVHLTVLGREA